MSMNFTQVWAQLKAEWAGRTDGERRLVSLGFEDAFDSDEVDDFGIPIHGMLDEVSGVWVSAEELERIRDDHVFGAEAWNDLCIAQSDPCDPAFWERIDGHAWEASQIAAYEAGRAF